MRLRVLTLILGSAGFAVAAACGGGDGGDNPDDGADGGPNGQDGALADGQINGDGSITGDGALADGAIADGGSDAADSGDAAEAGPVITYKHFDINHVLSTGASDSVANGASAFLTTTQPFTNISFDTGVITGAGGGNGGACSGSGCTMYQTPAAFKPLVEGDKFLNFGVETMSSGLGNQASVFATDYFAKVGLPAVPHDVLVSLHGRSGNPYWCLRRQFGADTTDNPDSYPCYFAKTSNFIAPFDEAMMQVQSAKTLAADLGKTYVVRGVTAIAGQGEADTYEQNFTFLRSTDGANRRILNYTEALFDWQLGYETQVKAITAQTEPVPMFISQFGTMTTPDTIIVQRQLDAHNTSNGKIVLVTPNYPFEHYIDCLHYTAHSQRRLGAYFAKAYHQVVVEGRKWEPTRPSSITRAGATITVKYVVPVPPLVIDELRVSADGSQFPVPPVKGFIFRDSTMSASITAVAVTAADTVTITLSNAPTGANPVLRYAYESQIPAMRCPGPMSGARGNIRDSDTRVGYHTDENGSPYELFNWSVAFQLAVP